MDRPAYFLPPSIAKCTQVLLLELLTQVFSNHYVSITAVESLRQNMAWSISYKKVELFLLTSDSKETVYLQLDILISPLCIYAHTFIIFPCVCKSLQQGTSKVKAFFLRLMSLCTLHVYKKLNSSFHLHDFFCVLLCPRVDTTHAIQD